MKVTKAFMLIFFADIHEGYYSAYFINMNLQRFVHSYKFNTYASGGKRKFFDARFNSKNIYLLFYSDTNIQSYVGMQL